MLLAKNIERSQIFDCSPIQPGVHFLLISHPSDLELPVVEVIALLFMSGDDFDVICRPHPSPLPTEPRVLHWTFQSAWKFAIDWYVLKRIYLSSSLRPSRYQDVILPLESAVSLSGGLFGLEEDILSYLELGHIFTLHSATLMIVYWFFFRLSWVVALKIIDWPSRRRTR